MSLINKITVDDSWLHPDQKQVVEAFYSDDLTHAVISGPGCGMTTSLAHIALRNIIENDRRTICIGHSVYNYLVRLIEKLPQEVQSKFIFMGNYIENEDNGAGIEVIPYRGFTRDFAAGHWDFHKSDLLIDGMHGFCFEEDEFFAALECVVPKRTMVFQRASPSKYESIKKFPTLHLNGEKPHPVLQFTERMHGKVLNISSNNSPLISPLGLAQIISHARSMGWDTEKYLAGEMF